MKTIPADVIARRTEAILNQDADGFADLFAPDAVIESPFAGRSGMPSRIEGREQIRAYARQVTTSTLRLDGFEVTELYETRDPEIVIAEVRAAATLTTTGQSFTATSIQVLQIRHGQIVLFRDYANPLALENALAGSSGED
jgi:uncharacterized protein